ncbi:MAG: tetratricopeptide repeat-containing glycosyltransferase family protein [Betaproteobacteria bacterium]|nr:tetratricopeptide repeat-containing glycosyltransferase family protein [Betaproteobacteria bacterium]
MESRQTLQRLKGKLTRHPGDVQAWFKLGTAYAALQDHREAAATFGKILVLDPGMWEAWSAKGHAHHMLRQYPEAVDCYVKALQLNQGSASIRNSLASLLKRLGQLPLAEQFLREAIQIQPDYKEAINNLGNVYRAMGRHEEAQGCFQKTLALGNDCADVWNNLGLVYKDQMRLDEAIACYERALAFPNSDPNAPFNYAIALLQAGRMEEGWAWYEKRWLLEPLRVRRAPYDDRYPEWKGEVLNGRRLLVWSEQGLGDLIQMVRYLRLLQERWPEVRVILRAEAVFGRLFKDLAGMDAFNRKTDDLPEADFHLPAMSLPARFATDHDSIPAQVPYLVADPQLVESWKKRLGLSKGRLRVGLIWESGAAGVGQGDFDRASRSLSGPDLKRLVRDLPVDFVRLQLGGSLDAAALGLALVDPTPGIEDFADTAAIIASLDGVVSVDTAGAHLAAALGKPTWTLMRFAGGNLFPGFGASMPWYPTMRLIRQSKPKDWTGALDQVRGELKGCAR